MTILTPPDAFFRMTTSSFRLQPFSKRSPVSAFNQYSRVDAATAWFWKASFALPPMLDDGTNDTLAAVEAFLDRIADMSVKVRLYNVARRTFRGTAGVTTCHVDTAALAGATSLTVAGLTASQAKAVAETDMFGIGENLYRVHTAAPSDAAGKATLSFLPPLRVGAAVADVVNLARPTGLFVLTGGQDTLATGLGDISAPLSLEFREDPDLGL